ncbi:MAG: hypothetical protein IT578_03470 [Verrucomicrobiae bacterium]|nr:hypothetical protein [Verrucomicrobiae bacterium]
MVAILGMLAALGIRGLEAYKDRARMVKCISNVRALANGLNIYATDHEGQLPALTEDNLSVDFSQSSGALDLRLVLGQYDMAFWSMTCPSDPRRLKDPRPENPTYLSYLYLLQTGGDLGKFDQPIQLVREAGYHHGRVQHWKAITGYSDSHIEIDAW